MERICVGVRVCTCMALAELPTEVIKVPVSPALMNLALVSPGPCTDGGSTLKLYGLGAAEETRHGPRCRAGAGRGARPGHEGPRPQSTFMGLVLS